MILISHRTNSNDYERFSDQIINYFFIAGDTLNKGIEEGILNFNFMPPNLPPIAICKDITVDADGVCLGTAAAVRLGPERW